MTTDANNTAQETGARQTPQIGTILVNKYGLKSALVPQVLRHAKANNRTFGETAVRLKLVTSSAVNQALAEQFDATYIPPDSASRLSRELVTLFNPNSVKARNLRALRTRIMLRSEHLALAVNSAASGEGRSFLAANLAVSFAQLGKKSILVDANLINPRQHKVFALGQTRGLTEFVSPRISTGPHMFRLSRLPNLSIMPSGALPPNAEELLCGVRGAKLMEVLKRQYEVVIVDTPDANRSSMAEWLANQTGQSLLVARQHESRWQETQRLSRRLVEHANVLGVAITKHKG